MQAQNLMTSENTFPKMMVGYFFHLKVSSKSDRTHCLEMPYKKRLRRKYFMQEKLRNLVGT